jgi:hypothetical protein
MSRQRGRIVAFITEYTSKNGYPPTYREIAEGVGIALGGLHHHIQILLRQGVLTSVPSKTRTLNLAERPVADGQGEILRTYAQAEEYLHRLRMERQDDASMSTAFYHVGILEGMRLAGLLSDDEFELWERRLRSCPTPNDHLGGRTWCAYCGDVSQQSTDDVNAEREQFDGIATIEREV